MGKRYLAVAVLVASLALLISVTVYAGMPPKERMMNTGKCVISPPVNEPAWTIPPMPAWCH